MEEELLIGQALADIFDSPIDQVLTARLGDNDKLQGTVLSDGNIFRYELDEYVADLEHLDSASEELNAWADGYLNAHGIRTDSDLPFSYAMGFLRLDAQVKCKSGGTPCGRRCLPRGQKCRQGTGASGAMVGRAKSGMRRKAALGAGVLAAGVGAAYLATRKGKNGKSLSENATEAVQQTKKKGGLVAWNPPKSKGEFAKRAATGAALGAGASIAGNLAANAIASRRKSQEPEGVEEAKNLLKGSDEMKALPGSAPEPERKALPGSKAEPETKALSGSTSTPKALPPAKERALPPGKDGRQRRNERINKGTAKGNPNSVLGRATRPRDDDPNPYAKRESPIVTPAPKKKRGRPKKGS